MVDKLTNGESSAFTNPEIGSRSRFCLGVLLLLVVDVIWVASSEATRVSCFEWMHALYY